MIWMLHIHTTLPRAIVALSCDGTLIHFLSNEEQQEHASFLHEAINQLLNTSGLSPKEIKVVGATSGPGSYSGIRVGLSAAKGLCYGLKIPLVTFNTLDALAYSFYEQFPDEAGVVCPMIDARRMEVFTAIYGHGQNLLLDACALEIDADSYNSLIAYGVSAFIGSGAPKVFNMFQKDAPLFEKQVEISPQSLVALTNQKYQLKKFDDVTASDAIYLKPVYFAAKKS